MSCSSTRQSVYLDFSFAGPSRLQASVWLKTLSDELYFVSDKAQLRACDLLVTERTQSCHTPAQIMDCEHMIERLCRKKGIAYTRPPSPEPPEPEQSTTLKKQKKQPQPKTQSSNYQCTGEVMVRAYSHVLQP